MLNSSIWPLDRTLSGATTPSQNESASESNEEVLYIPQSSSITRVSPSVCLMSYQDTLWRGVLPFCSDVVNIFYSPSQLGFSDFSGFSFKWHALAKRTL